MGGGGSNPENTTKSVQVRFAPYIEYSHESCLNEVISIRNQIISDSPYSGQTDFALSDAIYAYGKTLTDLVPLYQVFGKYLASLDISIIFSKAFTSVMSNNEVNELLQAESERYDIDSVNKLVEYKLRMRAIGAVNSSSYSIGLGIFEVAKLTKMSMISSSLRAQLIPSIEIHFTSSLDFFQENAKLYAKTLQMLFSLEDLTRNFNDTERFKNALWPFSVIQFEATVIGALRGKASYQKDIFTRSRSGISTVLSIASYTVSGATIGNCFPPYGTIIGAVIGFVVGVAMRLLEG